MGPHRLGFVLLLLIIDMIWTEESFHTKYIFGMFYSAPEGQYGSQLVQFQT